MAAVKLGVFGGTFDPPHNGHLALARAARDQLRLERVSWVPAGDPWRKSYSSISPARHRLEMLRLAIAGEPAFFVDAREIERSGPTYTLDTLKELHDENPDAELVFLLGADALEDLQRWHEPQQLIGVCTLGATAREGNRPDDATMDSWLPGLSRRVIWFDMPRTNVSATGIRRRAAAGESLAGLVPDAVAEYIRRNKLYSAV